MNGLRLVLVAFVLVGAASLLADGAEAAQREVQASSDLFYPPSRANCRRWGWHGYGNYPCKCLRCKWKFPGRRFCWRVC
jgi:hypothetical protein